MRENGKNDDCLQFVIKRYKSKFSYNSSKKTKSNYQCLDSISIDFQWNVNFIDKLTFRVQIQLIITKYWWKWYFFYLLSTNNKFPINQWLTNNGKTEETGPISTSFEKEHDLTIEIHRNWSTIMKNYLKPGIIINICV